jgi:hypothetical protein
MEKRRPWYFSACSLIGLFLFLITAQAFALGIKHEDPLLPRFKISSGVLRDGELAWLEYYGLEKPFAELNGSELLFFQRKEGVWATLFAVPVNTVPGIQKLFVGLESDPSRRKAELTFELKSGEYREDLLSVDPKFTKISPKNAKRIEREQKEIEIAK